MVGALGGAESSSRQVETRLRAWWELRVEQRGELCSERGRRRVMKARRGMQQAAATSCRRPQAVSVTPAGSCRRFFNPC